MNRVSRRFVEYLSDEMDDRPDIRETTLKTDEVKVLPRKASTVKPSTAKSSTVKQAGAGTKQAGARRPVTTQKVQRPAAEPQAYRRNAKTRADDE